MASNRLRDRLPFTPTALHTDSHSLWQVLGGAGYVSDYPVEQLYRDNRLNMIHEGTAGNACQGAPCDCLGWALMALVIASDGH